MLEADKWQHIRLRTPADNQVSHLVFYSPDSSIESVSYELNGFSFTHPEANTIVALTQKLPEDQGMRFILLGKPNTKGQYRYPFSEPVEVTKVQSDTARVNWNYRKDAQILELTEISFGDAADKTLLDMLPDAVRSKCEAENLVPVVAQILLN